METSTIALQEKVQNPTIHRKTDAYSVLVVTRPSTGTLSGERHNNKQCVVQWHAYWQAEACNSSKCQGLLSKSVVFLHDNACPHTAAHTAEKLWKLKSEVMAHPPYSTDLARSDYHLFGPLKEALMSCRFTLVQEVKEAVHAWLAAQPKIFFSEAIRKLVQRWTKCVEKLGDYVEKDVNVSFLFHLRHLASRPCYSSLFYFILCSILFSIFNWGAKCDWDFRISDLVKNPNGTDI